MPIRKLTALREARGWTRTDLARASRTQPSRIGEIENGRFTPPKDSVILRRLARALKWIGDPAALLEEADK